MATSAISTDDHARRKSAMNNRKAWTNDKYNRLLFMPDSDSRREIVVKLGRSVSAVETRIRNLGMK